MPIQTVLHDELKEEKVVVATRSWISLVAVAIGGVLLVAFLYAIRGILAQLLAASVLAISLEPLVRGLERRRLARPAAVALTFVAFLVATAAFVYALLPPILEELPRLVRQAPQLLESLGRMIPLASLEERLQADGGLAAWWEANGATLIGEPTLRVAKGFLVSGSEAVTIVFLALFLLLSGPEWFRGVLEVVPARSRALAQRLADGVIKAVGGYVLGNVFISVIAGTVATVLLLVMHVPYALPLGLVVAVFDLIPMVGATLALVIVGLVALTQGVATCAVVVGALLIYQLVENYVLTQAVYHGTVKLSLVTIAVSLAIGAELGGVAGAVMAIPIAGAIKVVFEEVRAWRRAA
ncbi:MAG TPA: AI-2E family transporter [Candidatus Polarisedimenticolia bacterium]|nr:AI-2E family transporter [Candidatus Polarisedimenticolia bacterium]